MHINKVMILAYSTCTSDKAQPPFAPTLIKTFFPTVLVRNTIAACNRTPGSYLQSVQVPHPCSPILDSSATHWVAIIQTLFAPLHSVFIDHRLFVRLGFALDFPRITQLCIILKAYTTFNACLDFSFNFCYCCHDCSSHLPSPYYSDE